MIPKRSTPDVFHAYMHKYVTIHVYLRTHSHTNTCIHTYMRTHIQSSTMLDMMPNSSFSDIFTHKYSIKVYICVHTLTRTRTHTCMHACIHTDMHSYIRTYMQYSKVMDLMPNGSLSDVLHKGTHVLDGGMIGNIIQDVISA